MIGRGGGVAGAGADGVAAASLIGGIAPPDDGVAVEGLLLPTPAFEPPPPPPLREPPPEAVPPAAEPAAFSAEGAELDEVEAGELS